MLSWLIIYELTTNAIETCSSISENHLFMSIYKYALISPRLKNISLDRPPHIFLCLLFHFLNSVLRRAPYTCCLHLLSHSPFILNTRKMGSSPLHVTGMALFKVRRPIFCQNSFIVINLFLVLVASMRSTLYL